MENEYLPVKLMNEVCSKYPRLNWQVNHVLKTQRLKYKDEWPRYAFLPTRAWLVIASELKEPEFRGLVANIDDLIDIQIFGTWRYSQKVYKFDSELMVALADSEPNQEIPVDVLLRIPDYCCYIEFGVKIYLSEDVYINGFFTQISYDYKDKLNIIDFYAVSDKIGCVYNLIVPLIKGKTIYQSLEYMHERAISLLPEELRNDRVETIRMHKYHYEFVEILMPYILYLCSSKPDIINPKQPNYTPTPLKPMALQKPKRLLPATKPQILEVGTTIGAQLRQVRLATTTNNTANSDTRKSPKAHIRRGHWHGYWTGPRTGKREFTLKWLHPMLVNIAREAVE